MKKGILFLSLFVVLFASCNDATDIIQKGELNDARLFTNIDNLQLFLNETYDKITLEEDILTCSKLSDEIAIAGGLTSNDTQRFFVPTTVAEADAIFNNHYLLINYCNRLLRGATYFTPAPSEVADYNSMLAQARALRAFAHLQLMTFFSEDMSNLNGLGVLLVDHVPTTDERLPRATNGALFDFIEADLNYAAANLGRVYSGAVSSTTIATGFPNEYKYVNINMINALRARMYLYKKDYPKALIAANAVIDARALSTSEVSVANFPATSDVIPPVGPGTGSTSVNTSPSTTLPAQAVQRALWQVDQWVPLAAPEYRKIWVDAIQGEVLYAVERPNSKTNWGSRYNTNGSYLTAGPLFDMGRNLFNLYTQPLGGGAQDFRRWCFVDRSATILANPATATRNTEQIVIDKYPGKSGAHTANDLKVFRASEIYFIKAECLARNNDLVGAADLIRKVRVARNYVAGATVPMPVYANQTAAFADILTERRKELAFEGHRYLDLKRLGADAGVTGTDRDLTDGENSIATSPLNILLGDYRFTLPIPQKERNVNPVPQNTGYSN